MLRNQIGDILKRFLTLLIVCWFSQANANKLGNSNAENFYRLSGHLIERNKLVLTYNIDNCCYIYKRSLTFNSLVSGAKISNVIFPNALQHKDEFFGEVEVYRGELVISMDVEISQKGGRLGILKLVAKQQGCSDEGICFLPEEKILNFSFLSGLN